MDAQELVHGHSRAGRAIAAVVLLASPALAADWYVDAVAGSNANAGNSPAAAWRTISHALASVATPPAGATEVIHVAAGTYDAALGESFPLAMRPGLQLVGSAQPVLDASALADDLIRIESSSPAQPYTFAPDTLVDGFKLQRGANGVVVRSNGLAVHPTLRNLHVTGMSVSGIACLGNGDARPAIEQVLLESNQVGVRMNASDPGWAAFDMADSTIRASLSHGIDVFASGGATAATVEWTLRRSRIEQNQGDGIHATCINRGSYFLETFDTLVRGNAGHGVYAQKQQLHGAPAFLHFASCTVAHNGLVGVGTHPPVPPEVVLTETIVHGNADDILNNSGSGFTAQHCDIGDPDFPGVPTVFHADPLFTAPLAGDFTLQPGSPCIDAGNPALPLDPDCSRSDVGAFAFVHPLATAYCTAKSNSCGTLPAMSSTGAPSASATSGFLLRASSTRATRPGVVLYGDAGRAGAPFQGGFLCVAAPVRRSVIVLETTGTPGQCDGTLALDMNAFAAGALGGSPLASLRVPGTRIDAQFWARDSLAGPLLTDALEYFVCP